VWGRWFLGFVPLGTPLRENRTPPVRFEIAAAAENVESREAGFHVKQR